MRKQTRPTLPAELATYCDEWQQTHNARNGDGFTWYEREGKDAREHLVPHLHKMNQGHCSFCDAYPLENCSNEPIEHHRPKSKFPELAYAWINLYYICEKCNTTKNDRWDDRLLRPDDDKYAFVDFFTFTIRGDIEPNRFAGPEDQDRAQITISIFGLDLPAHARMRLETFEKNYQKEKGIDFYAYRDFLEFAEAYSVIP
jgi:uncharacterized protein (TIGR02646 family)